MSATNDLKRAIEDILSTIRTPTGQTLAEAHIVANAKIDGVALHLVCRDFGWPEPIRRRLEREVQTAVSATLPQFETCEFEWTKTESESQAPTAAATELPRPEIRHIVAVGSGKGGVGKSTVAASLAFALKLRGHNVGLMDADVYGPSIPHLVGLSGERPTVADGRYVPPAVDGIKTISMGFLVSPEQAVVWRGPMLHKAVRDFLYLVDWGKLDFLIVDLPPGTGDVVLSLSQQMPISGSIIVCTPQDVALLDARKALNMFRTVKIPCRGVVENMSYFHCPKCGHVAEIFGHGGAQRWAKQEMVPFLGSIPINLEVRINGDAGKTKANFDAESPVRDALLAIADKLVEGLEADAIMTMPQIEIVE